MLVIGTKMSNYFKFYINLKETGGFKETGEHSLKTNGQYRETSIYVKESVMTMLNYAS